MDHFQSLYLEDAYNIHSKSPSWVNNDLRQSPDGHSNKIVGDRKSTELCDRRKTNHVLDSQLLSI